MKKESIFRRINLMFLSFFAVIIGSFVFSPMTVNAVNSPPSIWVNYNTAPTNILTVTVSAMPNNKNGEVGYIGLALGTYTKDNFPGSSVSIVDPEDDGGARKSYTITENGTYTAYAYERAGKVEVFTITNIGTADTTPPNIELQLMRRINLGDYEVRVISSDSQSGVVLTKWDTGNRSLSYFATGGITLGTTDTFYFFPTPMNGVYTVYSKDAAGNESVKTIEVKVYYEYHYLENGRIDYIETPAGQRIKHYYDNNGNLINRTLIS